MLRAVILTDEEKMLLTPTYHVMEMYKVHQDATLLPLQLNSAEYQLAGEKLPAIWASASRNKQGTTHISLVNVHANKAQEITIDIKGANYKKLSGRILSSKKLQDYNTFENPNLITPQVFKDARLKGNTLTVKLPPFSVVVLAME